MIPNHVLPTRLAVIGLFLGLTFPKTIAAQERKLRIMVEDPSGAIVPDTKITVSGEDHKAHTMMTDQKGRATISVPYGSYDLAVDSRGFIPAQMHVAGLSGPADLVLILSVASSASPLSVEPTAVRIESALTSELIPLVRLAPLHLIRGHWRR